MNRKRLHILKRTLLKVAKEPGNLKFDLAMWAVVPSAYIEDDPVDVVAGALAGENYCGTTACACGIAATIPSFKRDGLSLHPDGRVARLHYQGDSNASAAAAFFEIPFDLSIWLFEPTRYPRRQRRNAVAVAKRIGRVLEGFTSPECRSYY